MSPPRLAKVPSFLYDARPGLTEPVLAPQDGEWLMHLDAPSSETLKEHRRWYEGMTGYHWWVLVIAAMAWLFVTMDQRLFVLSRGPALAQLLDVPATDSRVVFFGRIVTALMMLGWAVGG